MRDAAHHIGAQFHGAGHQLAAALVRLDAFLREGDDLQVNQVAGFFTDFKHRLERAQRRVGDVDMGAHVLNAMLGQHTDSGVSALLGVFVGNGFLALGPALNAFEQRTALIPLGLARGQGRVQMNVWLDQRRNQQLPLCVNIAGLRRSATFLQGNSADALAFATDGVQA